jgi:hypothetical protein
MNPWSPFAGTPSEANPLDCTIAIVIDLRFIIPLQQVTQQVFANANTRGERSRFILQPDRTNHAEKVSRSSEYCNGERQTIAGLAGSTLSAAARHSFKYSPSCGSPNTSLGLTSPSHFQPCGS